MKEQAWFLSIVSPRSLLFSYMIHYGTTFHTMTKLMMLSPEHVLGCLHFKLPYWDANKPILFAKHPSSSTSLEQKAN